MIEDTNNYNNSINPEGIENNNVQENVEVLPQQQFTNYQQPINQENQIQPQNFSNEVAYYPNNNEPQKKKKKKGKIIFKSILAVICICAISFGSISGYVALTDNGYDLPFFSTNQDKDDECEIDDSIIDEVIKKDKDMPTLLQMAGKENAMSVPEIVKKVSPSVVGISSELLMGTATGTGIIMTKDGYIITNGHVVEDATSITVVISDGEELDEIKARLIGIDTQTDLAVIKVDKSDLIPAEFGKSDELQVGELAIAIGNPLGFELAGSVTGGIISALDRQLTIEDTQLNLIQTDAAINPGNSGGPLVNSYGQVIGINSAKISSAYAEGLGFAIPIDGAKPIIDNLIEYGYVKGRPMLGISGQDITAAESRYYDLPQGVSVVSVATESGAEKAGIKRGDIVIGIDGKTITTMSELNKIKEEHKAGETVKIALYRDDKNIEVDVVLTEAKK